MPSDAQGCPIDDFGRRIYPETCTAPVRSASIFTAPLRLSISSPAVMEAIRDAYSAVRARAATMPDEVFFNWDAGYASRAELQDMRRQARCGGGGCNDFYCNWQMWAVLGGIPCDPVTFSTIMFQMERYIAAQERLKRLMANCPMSQPRTWWESVSQRPWNATQAADGRMVGPALAQLPDHSGAFATNAVRMADWCIEVMRTVAVARWASNTRWSDPFWVNVGLTGGARGALYYFARERAGFTPLDPNDPSVGDRPPTPAEVAAGAGWTIGWQRTQEARITTETLGWGVDSHSVNGFARYGYVRGTSPYGVCAPGAWQLDMMGFPAGDLLANVRIFSMVPYVYLSPDVALRWATDSRGTPYANAGGVSLYPPGVPVTRGEWDPEVMAGQFPDRVWGSAFALPASSNVRDVLIALFRGTRNTDRSNLTLLEHAAKRWDLRLKQGSDGVYYASPGPLRQTVLCMQLANDIIGRNWGGMMADSFGDYVRAVSQLPPVMRTLSPEQMAQVGRAITQANVDAIAAQIDVAGGIATGVATAINPIVGAVVAAVYAIISALVHTMIDSGLARVTNPPCLPAPVLRALPEPAEGNACWLVPDQTGARGGSSSILQRSGAIESTARDVTDPTQMLDVYRATEAAAHAEIGRGPPTPGGGPPATATSATTGVKVAAAAGGVGVGVLLARLLLGG